MRYFFDYHAKALKTFVEIVFLLKGLPICCWVEWLWCLSEPNVDLVSRFFDNVYVAERRVEKIKFQSLGMFFFHDLFESFLPYDFLNLFWR